MTANLTREQCIEKGLRYLREAEDLASSFPAAGGPSAILAQAHLMAASLMSAEPAGAPESDDAIETLHLVAKRDRDGDLWISDGERWKCMGSSGNGTLPESFSPYTDVRIVPLTS